MKFVFYILLLFISLNNFAQSVKINRSEERRVGKEC